MRKIKWSVIVVNKKNENMCDCIEYDTLKEALLYHGDDEQTEINGIEEEGNITNIYPVKDLYDVLTKEQEKELLKKYGELNGNE